MFSQEELKRYGRHLILPEIGIEGQKKLQKASVLMVGAGGLGCPILQYLTAAGVGTIGILDFDRVEESNLQRQILYDSTDIGKRKVDVAHQKLQLQNPLVQFKIYPQRLDQTNALEILKDYDIIVDGSDNFETRYLVNDACVMLGKPLVFGAIFKFDGQVSVFNYEGSATYRCLFPEPPEVGTMPNCAEIGVLGVLPAIIGCLQASEVLKMIIGLGEVLQNKLLLFDALTMQFSTIRFALNPSNLEIKEFVDYEVFCGTKKSSVINNDTPQISVMELQEEIKQNTNLQLIDVREEIEHEMYNIGGKNIPLYDLKSELSEINPHQKTVVYCQKGVRSRKAIKILKSHFPQTSFYSLENGLQNWKD